MILLQDIMPLDKMTKDGPVLLVRHADENMAKIQELDLIEEFQTFQDRPAFRKCKYLISFIAEPNNYCKLYGVYLNEGIREKADLPYHSERLSPLCKAQNRETDFCLTLVKQEKYAKYEGRLIIDWIVPRGWYSTYGNIQDKEVIKVLPRNFVDEFPGLMNIKVSASELKKIIENPDSHSKWYDSLTRLQAVYLIMDKNTGSQYVGTTYGQNGLWQRWESYVKSGFTGGNKKLVELKSYDTDFHKDFQYSILEVLPKNANQKECINAENLWKEKLGTRAHGLNEN
ncbi:GIY-YIG nuclease family protein [Ancylomarina sp. YFZ004]